MRCQLQDKRFVFFCAFGVHSSAIPIIIGMRLKLGVVTCTVPSGYFAISLLRNSQSRQLHFFKRCTLESHREKTQQEMTQPRAIIRNAYAEEFRTIGELMVNVYSQLDGFPKEADQPLYYKMLANVGDLTHKPETELLVAVTSENKIAGAVVYFGDIRYYGSGGTATQEKNTAGFRLLAVDPLTRGQGIGKLLTMACITKAKQNVNLRQIIIHTTKAMQTAWKMYESIGFNRSEDLDFMQGDLAVYGFRYKL
jgi:GNAT superfamily N-acetyltransferase